MKAYLKYHEKGNQVFHASWVLFFVVLWGVFWCEIGSPTLVIVAFEVDEFS